MESVLYAVCSVTLIAFAGICSGLTLGLLAQSHLDLKILEKAGQTNKERENARYVKQVVKQYHRLLVTLVLSNAVALEALPVFMDHIIPPFFAVVLSVTAILLFGEIVPLAICAKYGLRIGAHPLVRYPLKIFMFLMLPINYPIGKVLDWVLGDGSKPRLYTKEQLAQLVEVHARAGIRLDVEMAALASDYFSGNNE